MRTEKYDAEYSYDYDLDVVNIEINKEYTHEKTIDLSFGIFLDFDEGKLPVNLEIISASKIIGIEKEFLLNPDGNVVVIIGEDIIEVEITFKFKNNDETLKLTALNDFEFPVCEISFALV